MKKIDGKLFKQMIISASNNLYNSYPEIDQLNVFPIPDGDTGTNMNLTMASGLSSVYNTKEEKDIYEVAKSFKEGLLFGARGNSGAILSQIWRGFADSLKGKKEANAIDVAEAFANGKEVAYGNVMNPVEGTMLTVIREASEALTSKVNEKMHISEVFDIYLKEAKNSLNRTPDLLPVLREAGVVDSGGAGFVKIIEGMSKALHNQIVEKIMADVVTPNLGGNDFGFASQTQSSGNVQSKFKHEEFGYCTEFILRLPKEEDLVKLQKRPYNKKRVDSVLNAHGNSIVSVHDEDIVKVHIHTKNPGYILTYAQQYGEFVKLKIENMAEQHTHLVEEGGNQTQSIEVKNIPNADQIKQTPISAKNKEYGLIAVANGEGICNLFKELGVDKLVVGGQTMNPSTQDFVDAARELDAKVVYIFPNNSNIIMAASQAADILKEECKINVIPSKSIPAGIASCMVFNPSATEEENVEEMSSILESLKTGEVTFSVRNTEINKIKIKEGDFMAITGKKILASVKNKFEALKKLIESLVSEDSSIITIYYGEDIKEKDLKELNKIVDKYSAKDIEVELIDGGQPVYSFLIAVE